MAMTKLLPNTGGRKKCEVTIPSTLIEKVRFDHIRL